MKEDNEDVSFKSLFFPFTTVKAIIYIFLIGFVVFGNVLFNGFVGDDNGQILDNPLVHSLGNIPQFFKGSTLYIAEVGKGAGLYYRPLMSTVFAFIYALSGATAFLFHLTQLLLHITNAILIFLLFKKLLGKKLSFVLSLFFLVHPINNEAVVYISNMQEELFAFFGLLALNFVGNKKMQYAIPVFVFLSLLSKESGIVFIPLVILYYYFFEKRSKEKTQFIIISTVFTLVFYILLRIFVGNTGLQTKLLYMSTHATLLERLYTLPSILLYYLKMLFYPFEIAFGWYWVIKEPNISNFWIPFILVFLFSIAIIFPIYVLKKKTTLWKAYVFFLTAFLLSIGIISQVFPLDLTVADRWFYIPLFALVGMLGTVLHAYPFQFAKWKSACMAVLIIVLGTFAVINISRTSNWSNNYELCTHDVTINTQSYILQYCASNELFNRQQYKEAKVHAQKAIQLYPGYFLSWYTLGKIEYALNDKEGAKEAFEKALTFNDFGLGSQELALIYVYEKKPKEAKRVAEKYLKTNPNNSSLWYALALANYLDGNQSGAITAAQKAYELQPTELTSKVYIRLTKNLPIDF